MSNRKGVSRIEKDDAGGTLQEPPKQRRVYAENYAIAIEDQSVKTHGLGPHVAATMSGHSRKVFIYFNGSSKGVVRKDDKATCGHKVSGSRKVFSS